MSTLVNIKLVRLDPNLSLTPRVMEAVESNILDLDRYISLLLKDLGNDPDPFKYALTLAQEGNVALAKRYLSSYTLSENEKAEFEENCAQARINTENIVKGINETLDALRADLPPSVLNRSLTLISSSQLAISQERFYNARSDLKELEELLAEPAVSLNKTPVEAGELLESAHDSGPIVEKESPTITDTSRAKASDQLDLAVKAWADITRRFSSSLKARLRPTEKLENNVSTYDVLTLLKDAQNGKDFEKNAERGLKSYFFLDSMDRENIKASFLVTLILFAQNLLEEVSRDYKDFDTARQILEDIITLTRSEKNIIKSDQIIYDFFHAAAQVYAGWYAGNSDFTLEQFEILLNDLVSSFPKQISSSRASEFIRYGKVLFFIRRIQSYKNDFDAIIRFYVEHHTTIENLASGVDLDLSLDLTKRIYNEAVIQKAETELTELELPSEMPFHETIQFIKNLAPYQVVRAIRSVRKRFHDQKDVSTSLMTMYELMLLLFDMQRPEELVFTREEIFGCTRRLRESAVKQDNHTVSIQLLDSEQLPVGLIDTLENFVDTAIQSVSTTDLTIARQYIAKALEYLRDQRRNYLPNTTQAMRHIWHMQGDHWIQILVNRQRAMSRQTFLEMSLQANEILADEDSPLVVFVQNSGTGIAQQINLALVSSDLNAKPGMHHIPLLRPGDKISKIFIVKPRVSRGPVELRVLLRYLDTEDNPIITSHDESVALRQVSNTRFPKSSPYVWGMPLREDSQVFFGREDVFEFLQTRFWGEERNKIIALQGERRMGKTSILHQIGPRKLFGNYRVVFFDLQGKYANIDSMNEFLFNFARRVRSEARLPATLQVERSSFYGGAREYYEVFDEWLDLVEKELEARDTQIVILFDEFERLLSRRFDDNVNVNQRLVEELLQHLRSIMLYRSRFNWIITGSWSLIAKQREYFSSLFGMALQYWVSYLKLEDAVKLIQDPVRSYITYDQDAIDRIYRLTGGHPFYIQIICDELFNRARDSNNHRVQVYDVNNVIDFALPRLTESSFSTIWASLGNTMSRKSLATVAEAVAAKGRDPNDFVNLKEVFNYLHRVNPHSDEQSFLQVFDPENGELIQRELVEYHPVEPDRVRIRSELLFRWLRKSKQLSTVIRDER